MIRILMRADSATVAFIGVLVSLFVGIAGAARAEQPARVLLDRVHDLNDNERHWTDRRQGLKLTIIDRRGGERHRELEMLGKRFSEDERRSILFFHAPPRVRGIGLLQWIESGKPDRHWLYLPALKRVRQITGASKRESFVGTDFSYEDLAIMTDIMDWSEEEASSHLRGDESVDGHECAVIELVPKNLDVAYGRIRVWLDRQELVTRKYEFQSEQGETEKTLHLSEIRLVGRIPSAHRLEMRNERTHSRTVVDFSKIEYDLGLADDTFTQRRLERGV